MYNDSLDKIYKVIDGNDVTVYNYYENDQLSSVTVPGGTTTSYTYDEEGNLLTLTNKKSDGTVLDSFTYTYSDDTLGVKNQVSKTETVGGVLKGTTSYEYDGLGRLTKTVTPDGVQNVYTYDGAGNRLTKTSTAGEESAVTEYTYDEQNRLLNTSAYVTGGTDEVNTYYGYDNNGNQISRWTQTEKTSGTEDAVTLSELGINATDETAVYEYDVFNRLTAIYQGDTIIENTYDGAGDNISRAENGVPVYYVYDGNTVILELDGNGAEKARNVYSRNLIARESDGEKAIYRYNGHGDVIALNAPNGDMIAEYAYDEFGQVIEEQAAPQATPMADIDFSVEGSEEYDFPEDAIFDNPYRYAGYEYLDEVELYDLNARYYDPSIARFLTEDPYYNLGNRVMGVYEINVPNVYSIMQANALYAYCGNSPVMFDDRAGLDLVSIRDYTNQYEGIVVWDDTNDMAYFTISGITLTSTVSGENEHGIEITNVDGHLQAESSDLDNYFGQALTWGDDEAKAGDIASSGLVMGSGIAMADSPVPGPADAVGAIVVVGSLVVAGGVAIYEMATGQHGKYGDATVKEVLKHRKGSIKQAPLPPGGPSWDKLLPLTMEEIRRAADKGEPGFKTIWKLLNDSRFYK